MSQALGVPSTHNICGDRKVAAQKFIMNNWALYVDHFFVSMDDMIVGSGPCLRHGQVCVQGSRRAHLAIIGPPCQPWSGQRQKNSGHTPASTRRITGSR